ncbi:hypothetical protein [Tenacibaculum ascidiaceicola]|uniref:hypothetical protein n=1 Tax=Tenacibaculum ascidiaceicola TaxID=1699411 RepID=UPI00389371D3
MKRSLKSIGAFAQENESLNNQSMSSVKGGEHSVESPGDMVKYSTAASSEGGDTDCIDKISWGPSTIYN